jgi:hypothetical protein
MSIFRRECKFTPDKIYHSHKYVRNENVAMNKMGLFIRHESSTLLGPAQVFLVEILYPFPGRRRLE